MALTRNEQVAAVAALGLDQAVANGFFLVDGSGGGGGSGTIDETRIQLIETKVTELESKVAASISTDNFGWFNYNNTIPSQMIPANVWTTIQNDTLGVETYTQYSPPDVNRMLDPVTGRVMLDELKVGDEVFIRHTINVVPYTNNTTYSFSHYFGDGGFEYRLPIGVSTILDEGAGVPTGDFLVDTHFFIKNENARLAGMLPQIFVTSEAMINYTGCYISVNRR
ncbi:hypothetical protein Kassivere_00187 [Pseudomonas phage vB_PpuM-Kassivere]